VCVGDTVSSYCMGVFSNQECTSRTKVSVLEELTSSFSERVSRASGLQYIVTKKLCATQFVSLVSQCNITP
jgi:hypothetical protein